MFDVSYLVKRTPIRYAILIDRELLIACRVRISTPIIRSEHGGTLFWLRSVAKGIRSNAERERERVEVTGEIKLIVLFAFGIPRNI